MASTGPNDTHSCAAPSSEPLAPPAVPPIGVVARFLNLLVPGAGLILTARDWSGVLLALMFALCGNVALAGWLIAPAAVPGWLSNSAAILAGLTWLAAQWLLRRNNTKA